MKMRKNFTKELNQSTGIKERQHLKHRTGIIKEYIEDRNKEIRGIKVKKIAEQIRSNIKNGAKIRRTITSEEQQAEITVTEFMKEQIKEKRETIIESMVEKEINKMKRNRPGWPGWKAEWIKEGGEEMAKSLVVLFNRIEEEGEISKLWQLTTIKSVRKKGNQGKLSESQRGLFMVNVVSKVYRRVKKTQNKKIQKNMNQMQCAGRMRKSTMDNNECHHREKKN